MIFIRSGRVKFLISFVGSNIRVSVVGFKKVSFQSALAAGEERVGELKYFRKRIQFLKVFLVKQEVIKQRSGSRGVALCNGVG